MTITHHCAHEDCGAEITDDHCVEHPEAEILSVAHVGTLAQPVENDDVRRPREVQLLLEQLAAVGLTLAPLRGPTEQEQRGIATALELLLDRPEAERRELFGASAEQGLRAARRWWVGRQDREPSNSALRRAVGIAGSFHVALSELRDHLEQLLSHRYVSEAHNIPESVAHAALNWAAAWGEWTWAQKGAAGDVEELGAAAEAAYDDLIDWIVGSDARVYIERDGFVSWRSRETGEESYLQLTCA
jgi:hypothetical protein